MPLAGASGRKEPAQPAPASGDAETFARTYYDYLPDDTDRAYALLSSDYRARTSDAEYDGFWRTVSAVQVRGTRAVDDTTVDVELTYTTDDGGTEDETRRLWLTESGGRLVIADDTAL